MRKATFDIPQKASVSLASLVGRKKDNLRPASAARVAGFAGADPEQIHETDTASLIIESTNATAIQNAIPNLRAVEQLEALDGYFLSAKIGTDNVERLINDPNVTRLQSKKRSIPHLDSVLPEIGVLANTGGPR